MRLLYQHRSNRIIAVRSITVFINGIIDMTKCHLHEAYDRSFANMAMKYHLLLALLITTAAAAAAAN